MRDNPEAVAAPVEQPGMASKGDGTLGKGMARDKVSLPLWFGGGGKYRARGYHETLETQGHSRGLATQLPRRREQQVGGCMSCSSQLLEDVCSGQSDQEVAMSLLIPACFLRSLPKEVPS